MTEAQEQKFLFQWVALAEQKYPELELLHHIPNGGKRNVREAASLKKQGVKSGVPDICLPSAHGGYHGLYIELKVGKNKTSDNQNKWLEMLMKQKYFVSVCYGWRQAADLLEEYLSKPETK